MKKSIIAGLFLLFSSVIILLILTGGYALYLAGGISETGIELKGSFLNILLASVPVLLPPALAVGYFATFIRLRRSPGFRPLTFLFLFIVSTGLLWLAGTFMGNIHRNDTGMDSEKSQEYPAETFIRLESGAVFYSNRIDGMEKKGLLIRYEEGVPGALEIIKGELPADIIRNEINEYPSLTIEKNSSTNLYEAALFSDFILAGGKFLDWRRSGDYLVFILAIGAFSLYLTSCWGIMQISGWPLFNALLTMLLLSGGGLMYRVFSSDIFEELLAVLENRTMGIPPVVLTMAGASILLILLDLLFIPYIKRAEE